MLRTSAEPPKKPAQPLIQQPVPAPAQDSGAWLGAESTDAPNVRHNGVTLPDVDDHGPAYNAGLRAGDVILNMAGTYVYTVEDLTAEIQKHQPGARISVRYLRGALTNETYVVLGHKSRL
jgi:S1-C subfamily serine protease